MFFLYGGGLGFNPNKLSGLSAWLDANDSNTITESGGAVSQWDDKSGNGNHVTQGTGANQPVTNATTKNSKNVIDFDGSAWFDTPAAYNTLANDDITVFIVSKQTTSGVQGTLLRGQASGSTKLYLYYASSYVVGGYNNNSHDSVASNAGVIEWNTITFKKNGATQGIQINSGTEITDSAGVDVATVDAVTIGADYAGSDALNGSIAEIIIYNRNLTEQERALVKNYLTTKWAIAFVPTDLDDIKLWVEAGDSGTVTETTGDVSQWDDKSGESNNLIQGTGVNQPALSTGAINSRDAISADGSNHFMGITAGGDSLNPGTGGFTVFVVVKPTSDNSLEYMMTKGNRFSPNPGWCIFLDGNITHIRAGVSGTGSLDRASQHITDSTDAQLLGLTLDGSEIIGYRDGTTSGWEPGLGGPSDQYYTGDITSGYDFKLFSNPVDGSKWAGLVAELIIYKRELSADEMSSVNSYLNNKYSMY